MSNLTLSSRQLKGQTEKAQVFNAWGCVGDNRSPQLSWTGAPEGTKSFAITLFDPDAPTGSGWWHWLVFDIPASISELPENAGDPQSGILPAGVVQSINDYKQLGYGGPCPPEGHGIHQYLFTLHALDVESLGLSADTNPAVVGFNLHVHTIQKASLVMYYQR